MTDVTRIFEQIVAEVSKEMGYHINYIFGDWSYISSELKKLGDTASGSASRFPAICLYTPFWEDKTDRQFYSTVKLDFIIMINTLRDYSNEDRRKFSFEGYLYPIYKMFIEKTAKCPYIDIGYGRSSEIPHRKSDNYRYGRLGVKDEQGKEFISRFDGIDIQELTVKIKKEKCNGKSVQRVFCAG